MNVWEGKHIVWIQLLQTLQPAATLGSERNILSPTRIRMSTEFSKSYMYFEKTQLSFTNFENKV